MNTNIGVVYLCRASEKSELFSRFIHSYKEFSSNCDHQLIIIFKGFQNYSQNNFNEIQSIFRGLNYQAIHLPDTGFDIGSYLETAKIVTSKHLLFFNTHTTIIGNSWLDYLYKAISQNNVGLVGTTASYESIFSPLPLVFRYTDLFTKGNSLEYPHVFDYYQSLTTGIDPNRNSYKRIRRLIKFKIRQVVKAIFCKNNSCFPSNMRSIYEKESFYRFYNPYIRTNGFMISRELLLDIFGNCIIHTKRDACKFENGMNGLTRRVRELGMKTLLVGKNGKVYDVEDWPKSKTFRLGKQENLLISDNQTRLYDNASKQEKLIYNWIAWSNDFIRSKIGVPHLCSTFNTTPLTNMYVHIKD